MGRFAVVDVETTGFSRADRIVEVAVVVLDDQAGSIVGEFATLVNPQRPMGATGVHGITEAMVQSAPAFEQIAGMLAGHLHGRVLVAHNLAFDQRFLTDEFERAGFCVDAGIGVCTQQLTGERLTVACQRRGIAIDSHHRALADARAAAALLIRQATYGEPVACRIQPC